MCVIFASLLGGVLHIFNCNVMYALRIRVLGYVYVPVGVDGNSAIPRATGDIRIKAN